MSAPVCIGIYRVHTYVHCSLRWTLSSGQRCPLRSDLKLEADTNIRLVEWTLTSIEIAEQTQMSAEIIKSAAEIIAQTSMSAAVYRADTSVKC